MVVAGMIAGGRRRAAMLIMPARPEQGCKLCSPSTPIRSRNIIERLFLRQSLFLGHINILLLYQNSVT